MSLKVLALFNEEKTELERLEKFDSDWHVRERAKTLLFLFLFLFLFLCSGDFCPEVAA